MAGQSPCEFALLPTDMNEFRVLLGSSLCNTLTYCLPVLKVWCNIAGPSFWGALPRLLEGPYNMHLGFGLF
jgi:hypothetical protein